MAAVVSNEEFSSTSSTSTACSPETAGKVSEDIKAKEQLLPDDECLSQQIEDQVVIMSKGEEEHGERKKEETITKKSSETTDAEGVDDDDVDEEKGLEDRQHTSSAAQEVDSSTYSHHHHSPPHPFIHGSPIESLHFGSALTASSTGTYHRDARGNLIARRAGDRHYHQRSLISSATDGDNEIPSLSSGLSSVDLWRSKVKNILTVAAVTCTYIVLMGFFVFVIISAAHAVNIVQEDIVLIMVACFFGTWIVYWIYRCFLRRWITICLGGETEANNPNDGRYRTRISIQEFIDMMSPLERAGVDADQWQQFGHFRYRESTNKNSGGGSINGSSISPAGSRYSLTSNSHVWNPTMCRPQAAGGNNDTGVHLHRAHSRPAGQHRWRPWRSPEIKRWHTETCCAICLDEYADDDGVTRLPCRHAFHTRCIKEWLMSHFQCPVCKHELVPAPSNQVVQHRERINQFTSVLERTLFAHIDDGASAVSFSATASLGEESSVTTTTTTTTTTAAAAAPVAAIESVDAVI